MMSSIDRCDKIIIFFRQDDQVLVQRESLRQSGMEDLKFVGRFSHLMSMIQV